MQQHGLRALILLGEKRYSLADLSDSLCICPRHTQRVLEHLKDTGHTIQSGMNGRVKHFWVEKQPYMLPALLTRGENKAIRTALANSDGSLKTAICKLIQYVNVHVSSFSHT